ncbi:MAG: hypothetical protein ABR567_12190, partial [Myxococcales bacterium]
MRPRVVLGLALSVVGLWSVRCGTTQQPAIGSVGTGGDGGSGNGGNDGGTTSGPSDAGVTTATDAGTGYDAGSGGGATSDAGPAGGGNSDGGTIADECDGLSPGIVRAPTGRHVMSGDRVDCGAAVNAFGTLALSTNNVVEPSNGAIDFVGSDGTVRGRAPSGTNAFLVGRYDTFEGTQISGRGA